MTLSIEEISDRLEIQELFARYSHAIDAKQFDLLRDVFTPDAWIDYTATGGAKGNLEEIITYLTDVLPGFPAYQHLVANCIIELDGDTATSRTMCHNPMVMKRSDDGRIETILFVGLWYVDALVRTPQGWRIRERVEEQSYAWVPGT